jgi:diguanylate cyclase (GGDEF)-like protein
MLSTLTTIQGLFLMDIMIGIGLSAMLFFSLREEYICPGAYDWFISIVLTTLGLIFLLGRGMISIWISISLGNGLVVLGSIYFWMAFRKYTKTYRKADIYLTLIAPLVSLILLYCYWVKPENMAIRGEIVSFFLALFSLASLFIALNHINKYETGRWLSVVSLIFNLVSYTYRGVSLHLGNNYPGLLEYNNASIVLVFSTGISLLTAGFSIMLMTYQWLARRLYIHATYDALTGVYNRYALLEMSDTLELTTDLSRTKWCLAMIDIDLFKSINDMHGHPVGDLVLRHVAQTLKQSIRHNDILARYGGEEFAVVLPGANIGNATIWAERVRLIIASTPIAIGKASIPVSVSIGLTESSTTEYRLSDLVKNADSALYQAKQTGRNKVCCSEKMPHQVGSGH